MKLIIDISEGIYKHVDTIQNGSIGARQILNAVKDGIPAYKAIPPAEPCEDAISRQTVKEQMLKYGFLAPDMTVTEFVEDLPSVTSQLKTEHWAENLCDSCTNKACRFQSGIIRRRCAFYMTPMLNLEPDNCGNYVVMQSAAVPIEVLDKIRAEIEEYRSTIDYAISEDELKIEGMKEAYADCLETINKYRESDGEKCR